MKNYENENLIKISFTGDILCDFPELKYMRKNHYNFEEIFKEISLKEPGEYLVGNLETPICSFFPYTFEPFSFNSPKKFANTIKDIGFNLVSIANNHCLDRGIHGAKFTKKFLQKINLIPSGIYMENEDCFEIVKINELKVAFLSYTYGTNYMHNHCRISKKNKLQVNLLKKQEINNVNFTKINTIRTNIKLFAKSTRLWKTLAKIKKRIQRKKQHKNE